MGRGRGCTQTIFFFFQAEGGIRDGRVTGVQTCALPISSERNSASIASNIAPVTAFTLDNPGHENAVTGAMFDAMLAELRSEAVRPLARVLRLIIGLLSVQIIVVALFGVKPKKHRLEELDSESPLSPLPSQV